MAALDLLMRYLHVVSAVLAVGGAFFVAFLLPPGLRLIQDEALREQVLLKVRRAYKMTVHPAILGLLVSGVYNTIRNWQTYKLNTAANHAWWGPHMLLGLTAIVLSLWLLAGKSVRRNHQTWVRVNVALLLVVILLASALRASRLRTVREDYEKRIAAVRAEAGTPSSTVSLPPEMPPVTQPAVAP